MATGDASNADIDDPLEVDLPGTGRRHEHRRRVHLAEGSPRGRLRLDAVARMLQDVSDEDTTLAGFPPDEPWVVRRADVAVHAFPAFRDVVTVTTWCSGIGGRWAERRVRIVGDAGGRIEAAVLWVHLDERGRPARLPDGFDDLYGEAARGRRVRARLQHAPAPPSDGAEPDGTVRRWAFPLRFRDFDVMGHVNNAVSWEPVEDALADRPDLRAPLRVGVEHPAPIDAGSAPEVIVADVAGGPGAPPGLDLWIVVDGTTCTTARVRAGTAPT